MLDKVKAKEIEDVLKATGLKLSLDDKKAIGNPTKTGGDKCHNKWHGLVQEAECKLELVVKKTTVGLNKLERCPCIPLLSTSCVCACLRVVRQMQRLQVPTFSACETLRCYPSCPDVCVCCSHDPVTFYQQRCALHRTSALPLLLA